MKKLLKAIITISLPPLVAALFFYGLVLSRPVDQYSFRHWEALLVRSEESHLPGPYYPEQALTRNEVGDIRPYSNESVIKNNTWLTDEYGYRKHPSNCKKYVDVIAGDSFVTGTGLSGEQMPGSQYEQLVGHCALSLGYVSFSEAIANIRMRSIKPKTIYFIRIERAIIDWRNGLLEPIPYGRNQNYKNSRTPNFIKNFFQILVDRIANPDFFQYKKSYGLLPAIKRSFIEKDSAQILTADQYSPATSKKMLMYQGISSYKEYSSKDLEQIVSVLVQYQKMATDLGAKFIFVPIPNKETIYPDQIPTDLSYRFLNDLGFKMQEVGIRYADIKSAFLYSKRKVPSLVLYQSDDTHWNENGIRLAVETMKSLDSM